MILLGVHGASNSTLCIGTEVLVADGRSKRSPTCSTICLSSSAPNPTRPSLHLKRAQCVMAMRLDDSGAPRPLVFGTKHRNRHLRGIRIRRDAVIEEILRRFLDLHVTGQR